jgi:AcrR family transcriptional regulator
MPPARTSARHSDLDGFWRAPPAAAGTRQAHTYRQYASACRAPAATTVAVAAQAGVSKGGLLYHFKSKRELVQAMIERWLGEFQKDIEAADEHFVRGYVKASAPAENELGMLAALVADPALLAAVREQYTIWQDRVEREGHDPADATVARLAADGLWLAELFGMAPPTGALREQVLKRLEELAAPVD